MNLSTVSIRRPVFALMLILGLVTLGLVSLRRLDIALNPAITYPFVSVTTVLRGASPETVESDITDVIEEQVNTIEGIRTLSSVSSEGVSSVFVEFDLDYDVNVKAQHVRDKVALARPLLPLDAEDPVVQRLDPDAAPILTVMLGGPISVRELSEYGEHVLKPRLERLPGVGSVSLTGAREREIRIWLDPVRLSGYGLSVDDIANTLRRENADLAGGRIESSEREWSVTTAGEVERVEDFGALLVAERAGSLVHLRDVAQIEDGLADLRSLARLNGQPGVALPVRRQSGSNTVAVARAVRAEVEAIRSALPPGFSMAIERDMSVNIERSIRSIFEEMLLGGALVVAVVLFFLRNNRSTLIAALAIPASVVSSFTLYYAAGFTLNSMSLMGLSLSIGLVIDDAIVVLEAIYRRIERGEPAMRAAELASSEVTLAVVSTTLAVCAVFVPIAFMEGMVGVWFYEFGLVVVFAVSVSTLVALSLTPMLASRMLRRKEAHGAVYRALGRFLDGLDAAYRRALAGALRHKGWTLGAALLTVAGGCGVARTLPFDFYKQSDMGEFSVQARFPVGTPLVVTDALAQRIERRLAEHPDVRVVHSTVGGGVLSKPNEVSLYVKITPKQERDRTQPEIMREMRDILIPLVPEARSVAVSHIEWSEGMGRGRSAGIQYTLRGPELGRLQGYATELVRRMNADASFTDVDTSFESGRPEITLEIDRERAGDLGVPVVGIGRTIRTLIAGEKVGSFEELGRRYDVRLQILPEYRDDPAKLDLIRVRSLRGELVPITNVARPREGEGPVEIQRENRVRQIVLYANMAAGVALGVGTAKLDAWGREMGIAAPDELVATGRARAMRETGSALLFALALALVSIYMILASLFNSLVHPFTIMMSAPLSWIGGFLALRLAGMSLDLMSGIGLLVLMGLVMKNGILLVDKTNQLREAGRGLDEALLEAGPARMRPVLMTTGALIFGLLPVALGASSGSEFRAPMGMITVGGLATSTLLTLVVVPVVYAVFDRTSVWSAGLTRRLLRRARPAATTAR